MLLYFLPGVQAVSKAALADHGLLELLGRTAERQTFAGPRGGGMLLADADIPAELLSYSADAQVWSERYGLDSLVGTWHDHPVSPSSLTRPQQIDGLELELLDGNRWLIPQLRQWRTGDADHQIITDCCLPRVMQQSAATGRFILGEVVPRYRQLWDRSLDIAQQIFGQLTSGESAQLDDDHVNQFVIDLLAINYHVDASTVSHLQLLTPDHCGQIVAAALDLATLRHSLKNLSRRRSSGGTNTESGATPPPEASTTPTAPPPPN